MPHAGYLTAGRGVVRADEGIVGGIYLTFVIGGYMRADPAEVVIAVCADTVGSLEGRQAVVIVIGIDTASLPILYPVFGCLTRIF